MSFGTTRTSGEVGRVTENPRGPAMRCQLATLVRGDSVTTHCHAATAQPIREYQRDHRRQQLTSSEFRAVPLDISFHISRVLKKG